MASYTGDVKYVYYCNCVDWPASLVHVAGGLCEMIDSSIEISRKSFRHNVNLRERRKIETKLGYSGHKSRGLTIAQDTHVTYHRSRLFGRWVYYFKNSSIEYVFVQPSQLRSLRGRS